eukprot:scaffold13534_cov69-Cylindrotheca_fusiformis.AAC.4
MEQRAVVVSRNVEKWKFGNHTGKGKDETLKERNRMYSKDHRSHRRKTPQEGRSDSAARQKEGEEAWKEHTLPRKGQDQHDEPIQCADSS